MKINCYLSRTCGAEDELRENIARVLRIEQVEADVNFFRIDDAEAATLGVTGSPSVFIDDEEVQPQKAVGLY